MIVERVDATLLNQVSFTSYNEMGSPNSIKVRGDEWQSQCGARTTRCDGITNSYMMLGANGDCLAFTDHHITGAAVMVRALAAHTLCTHPICSATPTSLVRQTPLPPLVPPGLTASEEAPGTRSPARLTRIGRASRG